MKLCYIALERKSTLALLWNLSEVTTSGTTDGRISDTITLSIEMGQSMWDGLLMNRALTATATTRTLSGLHMSAAWMMMGADVIRELANRRRPF